MSEERKMVLDMLKTGKISVDEAEKLLEKIEPKSSGQSESAINSNQKNHSKKFIRIQITEPNDETKVNINIPLALAAAGLKFIPKEKLSLENHNINIEDILKMISEGAEGNIVDIEDHGTIVKIFID